MNSVLTILVFLIGACVGGLIATILNSKKLSGTFIIDFSDPIKDICRLELDDSLETIYKKKKIVLKVQTQDYISQE